MGGRGYVVPVLLAILGIERSRSHEPDGTTPALPEQRLKAIPATTLETP